MASAAQVLANQANAKLSTGPKTPEGKARASQNAVKHGLSTKYLVVRDAEREDFDALLDSLTDELSPEGPLEQLTFDNLIHAAWTLHRSRRLESEVEAGTPDAMLDDAAAKTLDRIARHAARAEKSYYRALKELKDLQTNRALRRTFEDEVQTTSAVGEDEPKEPVAVLASAVKLISTKRSQDRARTRVYAEYMRQIDAEAGAIVRAARMRSAS